MSRPASRSAPQRLWSWKLGGFRGCPWLQESSPPCGARTTWSTGSGGLRRSIPFGRRTKASSKWTAKPCVSSPRMTSDTELQAQVRPSARVFLVIIKYKLCSVEWGWMGPNRPCLSSAWSLGCWRQGQASFLVCLGCKCFGMGKSKQQHQLRVSAITQNHPFPAGDVLYEILQYIKTQRRALVCSPLLSSPFGEARSPEEGTMDNSSCPSGCPALSGLHASGGDAQSVQHLSPVAGLALGWQPAWAGPPHLLQGFGRSGTCHAAP